MKKAYLFIGLFAVWCLVSALWYMFWLKGLSPEPDKIVPHESALAIAEILIMALVSVLLGFAIAWHMREDSITIKQQDINQILAGRNLLAEEFRKTQDELKKAEHTLARARETFREDFFTITREKERLQTEVENDRNEATRLQGEISISKTSLQKQQEANNQLEQSLKKEQQSKHELEVNLEEVRKQTLMKDHAKSDFISERILAATQIEKEDFDDLKEIKGIGVVIEKKLNMLGIVNFKQMSELTDDATEQLSHTVKFFPGRIKRDKWVEQARELYNNAVGKA